MKQKLGIFLLIGLAATTIWVNVIIIIFSFGLVVMSRYDLESADRIVAEILEMFVFTFLLSVVLQFLTARYLIEAKRSLLLGLTISLFTLAGSIPFIFSERIAFMENGRPQALDIDIKNIQEIRCTNLLTGKTQLPDPKNRENIWSLEYQINDNAGKTLMKNVKYKIDVFYSNGQVTFLSTKEPLYTYVTL